MEKIKLALLFIIASAVVYIAFEMSQHHETEHADHPYQSQAVSNMVADPAALVDAKQSDNNSVESPAADAPPTRISFKETEHNFGKILQDSENKKVFSFTNTGDQPLIIQNAVGSCGCTVPTYSKEPIAPGKSGTIEVVYKPGSQKGSQTKTVTVTANTEPLTTILYIKADVQEKK